MIQHPIDPKIREIWRLFPLRLPGRSESWCCRMPTILVQSMSGGFVTRSCSRCGKKETLPEAVFLGELDLWVACPKCRLRMAPRVLEDKNYGYACEDDQLIIRLCDLLPRWEDL